MLRGRRFSWRWPRSNNRSTCVPWAKASSMKLQNLFASPSRWLGRSPIRVSCLPAPRDFALMSNARAPYSVRWHAFGCTFVGRAKRVCNVKCFTRNSTARTSVPWFCIVCCGVLCREVGQVLWVRVFRRPESNWVPICTFSWTLEAFLTYRLLCGLNNLVTQCKHVFPLTQVVCNTLDGPN